MKNSVLVTASVAALLALAGCGKSDSAKEQAQPDNVEMPAEETVQGVGDATPVADASAAAGAEGAAAASASPSSAAKP
ncbi:MAG: hypothetical protein ACKOOL_01975 [Novosphingobium sp.]